MKMTSAILLALVVFSNIAQAAPRYTGIGCNDDGTKCIAGKPSKRVLKWSKKGTVDELGQKCEKFLANIEARKNVIAKNRNVQLKYENFVYSWSRDLEANGQAKIICEVELHSETNVKFESKIVKKFYWVCENEDSAGICKNYFSDCEKARDQQLKDPSVLDATIYTGATILQGPLCEIATVRFK
ncbi:hypothetical protein ACES2L_08590 [Bdellovibrio bacteriovorus]